MQDTGLVLIAFKAVLWIAASLILVPLVAAEKGRSSWIWAITAIFLSPLLTLIALAAVPAQQRE